jgi:spore coat protein U-like protein
MKIRNSVRLALLVTASVIGAGSSLDAMAGNATNNLAVSATVVNNCAINSTVAVAFGNYDPAVVNNSTGADVTATGSLTITCTNGASTTVALGQGANAASGSTDAAPARQMVFGGTNMLAYALYQDSGDSTVWGNTVLTSASYLGSGNADVVNVYGKVPKGQNIPAGAYADTVVATVNF